MLFVLNKISETILYLSYLALCNRLFIMLEKKCYVFLPNFCLCVAFLCYLGHSCFSVFKVKNDITLNHPKSFKTACAIMI